VQSVRPPAIGGAPTGIPGGGSPRALPVTRGIWAIVADAPPERFSDEQLPKELQDIEAVSRYAVAHAAMIEFVFQNAPVIPLRLFTLFSGDERARQQLARGGSKIRALFARLRGLEEWGIRITAASRPQSAPQTRFAKREGAGSSGRSYLESKKRLNDGGGPPSAATKRQVNAALTAMQKIAVRTRKEAFPPASRGRPYVTGASFLVRAQRRGAWKKKVRQLASVLGKQEHRLEMSGPWPPYHFTTPPKGPR